MKIRPAILAISAVLVSALILGIALQGQADDPTPQSPLQQSEFGQSQLESFASAALEIKEIRSKWQSQMQTAEGAEKTREFQAQASTEMENAVEAKGLTVETYNAIATAARNNPDIAARIVQLMEKHR